MSARKLAVSIALAIVAVVLIFYAAIQVTGVGPYCGSVGQCIEEMFSGRPHPSLEEVLRERNRLTPAPAPTPSPWCIGLPECVR